FDFDNTVADTLPLMCATVNGLLRTVFPSFPECRLVDLESRTPLELIRMRAGSSIKPNLYWAALVERMPNLDVFPCMRDLLDTLRSKVRIGLQTSLPRTILMR